jgi:starch synthase
MTTHPHICMLAAENDVIPGAKVGGIGDVIRDIPAALANAGATVSVLIPAYGLFHTLPDARYVQSVQAQFMNRTESIDVYELFANRDPGVRYFVLHHPLFATCGTGHVYCDDSSDQPFAIDAGKFALFCLSALIAIRDNVFGSVDVLHLHDWHTGCAAILRAFDPSLQPLQAVLCVFSIHNLALQGVRPLAGHLSSLHSWFPDLPYEHDALSDPRWPDCVNPMAAGIRLADKVHTVSPAYASEIVQANAPERGFHGGEGLEQDLQQAADEQRLIGITNGIDYSSPPKTLLDWRSMMTLIADTVLNGIGEHTTLRAVDYLAHQRSLSWQSIDRPEHVLTSVGRLTDQKMALLLTPVKPASTTTVLDQMLRSLQGRGVFLLLGSGDSSLEAQCQQAAARHANFLFMNRYDQTIANLLYANGDLFVMPSSFEPCGISQMLAMRQGQPSLVHATGGLRDTVADNIDGYHFSGDSLDEQAQHLLSRLDTILLQRESAPATYRAVVRAARERRFFWATSASRYLTELYA